MENMFETEVIVECDNPVIENENDEESQNDSCLENEVSYVLPEKFSYCMEENRNILRIKEICTKEVAEEWMKKLSNVSKITWRVSRTYPRRKQAPCIFKKQYRCQHNTRRRMDSKECHKQSKNTNCPALLTVKIWSLNFCPVIGNEKWPCSVEFFGEHNHSVLTPSALRYRPLSDETVNALLELFRRGHTPATAYATYYADQMISFGEDFYANCSDRSYFPSKQDVANLWKKDFKSNYGGRVGEDMFASLEARLSELKNEGYQCGLSRMEDGYVVSICTPLMQRAHCSKSAKEVVFVDSNGNCGIQKHTIYFILTNYSGIGQIPLGCIITDSKKNHLFEEGLRMFFEDFEHIFGDCPQVVMTDEDFSEIKVLHKFFPQARFLLCVFHVVKACWTWLLNKHHNISQDSRMKLYPCFKELVYASNSEDFKRLEEQIKMAAVCGEPQFMSFFEKLLVRKDTWALHNRRKYLTKEYNANNIVEVIFRLFKDVSFEQTKSFNLVQLVDYITSSFEKRFSQGIMDAVYGNLNSDTIKRLCPNFPDIDERCVQKVSDHLYYVNNEQSSKTHEVDIGVGICSCPNGMKGKMCPHQFTVIKKYDIVNVQNVFSEEDVKELVWLATSNNSSLNSLDLESDKGKTCDISVPEVSSNVEVSTENVYDKALDVTNSPLGVESVFQDIDNMCSKLKRYVQDDPINMIPAVKGFLQMFEIRSQTSEQLISTLYTAFCGILPANIKSKHFSLVKHDKQIGGKRRQIDSTPIEHPKKRIILDEEERTPDSSLFCAESSESSSNLSHVDDGQSGEFINNLPSINVQQSHKPANNIQNVSQGQSNVSFSS